MAFDAQRYTLDLTTTGVVSLTGGVLAASKGGTYELTICNRTGAVATVNVAITESASAPGNADWIEYNAPVQSTSLSGLGGQLSRFPIPLKDGWNVWVQASTANALTACLLGIPG